MKSRHLLACAGSFAVVAACASPTSPVAIGETSSADTTAAPIRSDVFVYKIDAAPGAPYFVPVVVSFTGSKLTGAFVIACGANDQSMLAGFGYPNFDPNMVSQFDSRASLEAHLAETFEGSAPLVSLRCSSDPTELGKQVVAIYRTIDADKAKGRPTTTFASGRSSMPLICSVAGTSSRRSA